MTVSEIAALSAATALGLVHILGHRLRFLERLPRSRWLSAAGGISVAYVFIHLLPELARTSVHASERLRLFDERFVYLIAMAGLVVFYGVERRARCSRNENARLWEHVASFAVYNFLIGYALLHQQESSLEDLTLFVLAMVPHFIVNDFGLRDQNKELFRKEARWILAAAPLLGCLAGFAVEIPELYSRLLLAFLAGGVVLNILKEELPEERESRYSAFLLGAALYATVLLLAG